MSDIAQQRATLSTRFDAVAPVLDLELERFGLRHVNLIERYVSRLVSGDLSNNQLQEVSKEVASGLPSEATHEDFLRMLVLAAKSRIERGEVFDNLAARALCTVLYGQILERNEFEESFPEAYRSGFPLYINRGVQQGLLDPRLAEFDLRSISEGIQPERDRLLTYASVQMLFDRFLLKDRASLSMELPQYFWMRLSLALALAERTLEREQRAFEFYEGMSSLRVLPSTSPTLYHLGTIHPEVGCYVLSVRDTVPQILGTLSLDAEIANLSAGFGNDWTNVCGVSAWRASDQIASQGTVPFLKILDSSVAAFNRSGRRHSAACAYLETWHIDIEDFICLRKTTGDARRRLGDISTANWIPDLFMKRVIQGESWTLFSPDEVPGLHEAYGRDFEEKYVTNESRADRGELKVWRRVAARDLWQRMLTMLFESGHPWITFKDPCNVRSVQDHVGPVTSTNLCTEIILNAGKGVGVTTLGSVNLARHVRNGTLDWEMLRSSIKSAVRLLDNALDLGTYATPRLKEYAMEHRPIGMGIMGFQDLLYELDLPFDSLEACQFSDHLLEFLAYHATEASWALGQERGRYATFEGSKWSRGIFPIDTIRLLEEERGLSTGVDPTGLMDWSDLRGRVQSQGLRNCNLIAIAPTQTLSDLAGCSPSIEPAYKNLYVKCNSSGEFTILKRSLVRDLEKAGLWSDELLASIKKADGSIQDIADIPPDLKRQYRTAFEIDPKWVIDHAIVRGKWIDQGQSLNIFTTTESGSVLSDLYMRIWRSGLKTTYYLKTMGASRVEKSTVPE